MNDQGQYFDPYGMPVGTDPGGYRSAAHPEFDQGPAPDQRAPASPEVDLLDPSWDFEAELAQLLRESDQFQSQPHSQPQAQHQASRSAAPAAPDGAVDEATRVLRRLDGNGEPVPSDEDLESAPTRSASRAQADRRRRRRRRSPRPEVSWLHVFSFSVAALTACLVAMVSVLGGMVSYDPLRHLAGLSVPADLARWWPLLVYGPWLAASLSILRATVLRRRVRHSWAVVVLFSTVAVVLCVAHAPRTLPGLAVAGLPPITALACFHQLVGQITLTQPRHALPRRPGQSVPPARQGGVLPRRRTTRHGNGVGGGRG
ncbi:DUF2637 domain-containing protein [Streptomyces megasporus]|uniref:DUF2637 domain-containing protein n=1 Tax=Streptomyces megasporus TaxID=44060 RepID=UPI00068C810D|nr:DUF2637 domain-containing protein [Streptomyces megasporus]